MKSIPAATLLIATLLETSSGFSHHAAFLSQLNRPLIETTSSNTRRTPSIRRFMPSMIPASAAATRLDSKATNTEAETESSTIEESEPPSFLSELNKTILEKFQKHHPDTSDRDLLTFTLHQFKPLGCTAEESLVTEVTKEGTFKYVFISNIVEGGNAEKVGLEVSDVIVAVSGSFDDIIDTVGEGLDRVRGLIAGRDMDEGDALVLKVIRGSTVQNDHDTALVDMCILPEKDTDIENCIEALYKADYDIKESMGGDADSNCDDGDTDCMLDTMFNSWGEEMGLSKSEQQEEGIVEAVKDSKPAPWSSRSSPSGTYVRDPKTGKMVNIDE